MRDVRIKVYPDSEYLNIMILKKPLMTIEKRLALEALIAPENQLDEKRDIEQGEEQKELQEPENDEKNDITAKRSLNRAIQEVYDLGMSNKFDWFLTLTFNPESVDRYDYDACQKKLKTWIDEVRRRINNLKYIIVPEQHKDKAWHFHAVMSGDNIAELMTDSKRWSGSTKIYNIENYKLGWTTATKIIDRTKAVTYLTKYLTKNFQDIAIALAGRKKYWCSRHLQRPEIIYFMDNKKIIREYILNTTADIVSRKKVKAPDGQNEYLYILIKKLDIYDMLIYLNDNGITPV